MKTATTWDIVCAACQELDRKQLPFTINEYFPDKYEVIWLDENGTTTAKRLIKGLDDQGIRDFINQVVFA